MLKEWKFNGEQSQFDWQRGDDGHFSLTFNNKTYTGKVIKYFNEHKVLVDFNGKNHILCQSGEFASVGAKTIEAIDLKARKTSRGNTSENQMSSPMPGKILKVMAKKGDKVSEGQGLLVMEAMKMEHTIKASYSGEVEEVLFQEGDLVDGGVDLVKIKKLEEA